MKIAVIGGGGREHALAWKIRQSNRCEKVYLHPGNAGTVQQGWERLNATGDVALETVVKDAKAAGVSLIVVGPEKYLAEGYSDRLREEGFLVVGPNQSAARLETSKLFAKEFMDRAGIPTAAYFSVESKEALIQKTKGREIWPLVLKLDGLAAGKGVVIAQGPEDVATFAQRIWGNFEFGPAPHRVVAEEFISGRELSYIGLCDGQTFLPLASATDYKRVGDGDQGPNTGGMGCISPSPYFSDDLEELIQQTIVKRILAQLRREALDYRGALYVGVMVAQDGMPYVLEFNARFGDPETQVILPRLKSDFVEVLEHTARATLSRVPDLVWEDDVSLYVVAAAEGYPAEARTGDEISGIENVEKDIQLFFSNVKGDKGNLVTAGGRVLGLGAVGSDFQMARAKLYRNMELVRWNGIHFRKDIGTSKPQGT